MPRHIARRAADRHARIDHPREQRKPAGGTGGRSRIRAGPLRAPERRGACDRARAKPEGSPTVVGYAAKACCRFTLIENSNQSHQKNRTAQTLGSYYTDEVYATARINTLKERP